MKTKEELTALKEEVETLNKKLAELTEEELRQVTGGNDSVGSFSFYIPEPYIYPSILDIADTTASCGGD